MAGAMQSAIHAQRADSRHPDAILVEYRELDQYLAGLQLTNQRILLAERHLDLPMSKEQQQQMVTDTADLYTSFLLGLVDQPEEWKKGVARVDDFLKRYPSADNPELQVMRLQAEYTQAENAITKWLNDPEDQESFALAKKTLEQIAPKLLTYHDQLQKEVEDEFKRIDRMSPGINHDRLERENREKEAVVSRAAFFGGWAHYYLALAKQELRPTPNSSTAINLFRENLDIQVDPKSYLPWHRGLTADRLGLEQDWRARALIGLAMAHLLENDTASAEKLFEFLANSPANPEIIDQSDFWLFRGLINSGRMTQAATRAQTVLRDLQGTSTEGKTSLCLLLANTGLRDGDLNSLVGKMGQLGLVGLAKLGHHSTALKLIEEHQINIEDADGFYAKWLYGQQIFAEAEEAKDNDGYRQARDIFQAALLFPEAEHDRLSTGECVYALAWCQFRLGDKVEAAKNFDQASLALRAVNPGKAAEASWMEFVAYEGLSKSQPQFKSRAIDALEDLKRDFPKHQYARKANYLIARLNRSEDSPLESIDQLSAIGPTDPNYWTAKFDLCSLLKKQIDQTASEDEKRAYAKQILEVSEQLLTQYQRDSAQQKHAAKLANCVLIVVELARLNLLPSADRTQLLVKSASVLQGVPETDTAWANYHYQSLLLARENRDSVQTKTHADWLLTKAKGTPYEQSALILRALELDQRIADSSPADHSVLLECFEIYERLIRHIGSSAADLKRSKNSKVACSKLANYAQQLGKNEEALAYLRLLIEAYPTDQQFLQRLGRLDFQQGNYQQALGSWRTLAVGLPKGSEPWCEAKYYQLACLQKTDNEQAKKVLAQFKLLHSDWGLPPWRDKIKKLAQEIEGG